MRRLRFHDLSFETPEDWTDVSVVTLVANDSKRFQPNIVVTREDAPAGNLRDFAKSQVPAVKKHVKNHRLVSERDAQVAGGEGYVLEHSFRTPEKVMVRQLQYFVRSGADVVVVSLTCAEEELEGRSPLFTQIAESLRLEA